MLHFARLAVVLALLTVLLCVPSACGKAPASNLSSTGGTNQKAGSAIGSPIPLQKMPFILARLNAMMTFNFSNQDITFPAQLEIPSVPVLWMGNIFNGQAKEAGPGEDITDEVHGSISADGRWIESMYYSRTIKRTSNGSGVFYRVTLANIPLDPIGTGKSVTAAQFNQEGDVHKFVQKIEYVDGFYDGTTIVPGTTVKSVDWTNTATGKKPILQVTFETVASKPEQGPGAGPGGGM